MIRSYLNCDHRLSLLKRNLLSKYFSDINDQYLTRICLDLILPNSCIIWNPKIRYFHNTPLISKLIFLLFIFGFFPKQVNVVCAKVNGEPVYEIHRPIAAHQELVVYYLAERPEELLFVHMRSTLYRRTMDSILEGKQIKHDIILLFWRHKNIITFFREVKNWHKT